MVVTEYPGFDFQVLYVFSGIAVHQSFRWLYVLQVTYMSYITLMGAYVCRVFAVVCSVDHSPRGSFVSICICI